MLATSTIILKLYGPIAAWNPAAQTPQVPVRQLHLRPTLL